MVQKLANRETDRSEYAEILQFQIDDFIKRAMTLPIPELEYWSTYILNFQHTAFEFMICEKARNCVRFIRGSGLVPEKKIAALFGIDFAGRSDWQHNIAELAGQTMVIALQMELLESFTPDQYDRYVEWCKTTNPDLQKRKQVFQDCILGDVPFTHLVPLEA